jgi:hypothetical protein
MHYRSSLRALPVFAFGALLLAACGFAPLAVTQVEDFAPWLIVTCAISFLQIALLTPARQFPWQTGLRFVAFGMVTILSVIIPLEFLNQALVGCRSGCEQLGVWPDPLIEEGARLGALVLALVLVPEYRRGRLSDFLFWTIALLIGVGFVEDTFRLQMRPGGGYFEIIANMQIDWSAFLIHDPRSALAWLTTFLPGGQFDLTPVQHGVPEGSYVLPAFGWYMSTIPAAIGVWLTLRPHWRPLGIILVVLGFAWASCDHILYNWYVGEYAYGWAGDVPWFARLWQAVGQGHAIKTFTIGALIVAFVIDEWAWARSLKLPFGVRWLAWFKDLIARPRRAPTPRVPRSILAQAAGWWRLAALGFVVVMFWYSTAYGGAKLPWTGHPILALAIVFFLLGHQLIVLRGAWQRGDRFALGVWGMAMLGALFIIILPLGPAQAVWGINAHAIDQLHSWLQQLMRNLGMDPKTLDYMPKNFLSALTRSGMSPDLAAATALTVSTVADLFGGPWFSGVTVVTGKDPFTNEDVPIEDSLIGFVPAGKIASKAVDLSRPYRDDLVKAGKKTMDDLLDPVKKQLDDLLNPPPRPRPPSIPAPNPPDFIPISRRNLPPTDIAPPPLPPAPPTVRPPLSPKEAERLKDLVDTGSEATADNLKDVLPPLPDPGKAELRDDPSSAPEPRFDPVPPRPAPVVPSSATPAPVAPAPSFSPTPVASPTRPAPVPSAPATSSAPTPVAPPPSTTSPLAQPLPSIGDIVPPVGPLDGDVSGSLSPSPTSSTTPAEPVQPSLPDDSLAPTESGPASPRDTTAPKGVE